MPAHVAPRAAASSSARPAPQATSSTVAGTHAQVLVERDVLTGVGRLGQRREVHGPAAPALVHAAPLLLVVSRAAHGPYLLVGG